MQNCSIFTLIENVAKAGEKMKELNHDILNTLEFNQVKNQIAQYLVTDQGKEELRYLLPVSDVSTITSYLEETDDAMKVLRLRGGIPIPKIENIQAHMKRIEIGADLNGVELAQISRVLTTTAEVNTFFWRSSRKMKHHSTVYTLGKNN